jgi:hypothetical protein
MRLLSEFPSVITIDRFDSKWVNISVLKVTKEDISLNQFKNTRACNMNHCMQNLKSEKSGMLTSWKLSLYRLIDWFLVFNATFSYIMATRFSSGRSRSTRREPPTMGKQLVNFITCGCKSNAPFFVIVR